jgi:hypothetical protein
MTEAADLPAGTWPTGIIADEPARWGPRRMTSGPPPRAALAVVLVLAERGLDPPLGISPRRSSSFRVAWNAPVMARSFLEAFDVLLTTVATISLSLVSVGEPTAAGVVLARQPVTPPVAHAVRAGSRIVYLNRTGITVSPGDDDSRLDRSSIPTEPTTIPPVP